MSKEKNYNMNNKILLVDFINKKVTRGYTGPSGQVFSVLPATKIDASKRVVESIEKIDRLMRELKELSNKKKGIDTDGD